MIYTVIWTPAAQQQLADVWVNAADKDEVSAAAHWIDGQLRRDAHRRGFSAGTLRGLLRPPLGVLFTVDMGDCKVHVVQVRRTR
jgi:hypothetical protein